MNNKNFYAVLMAGGVGSRFWPVSTSRFPKQFHDMLGTGSSLIQKTFSRLSNTIPEENIFILTNAKYDALVKEQLPTITDRQIVLEPAMHLARTTAVARAFGLNSGAGSCGIFTIDNVTKSHQHFLGVLNIADKALAGEGAGVRVPRDHPKRRRRPVAAVRLAPHGNHRWFGRGQRRWPCRAPCRPTRC